MSTLSTNALLDAPRLSPTRAGRIELAGKVAAVLGLLACGAAALADSRRFGFSYLVSFALVWTLALGALFFVQLQHLTRAGWSVGPRRQMEWLASAMPLVLVLFVPLALMGPSVWGAWMGPQAAEDHLVHAKHAYLNAPFFYARAAVYFAVWVALARFFTRASAKQDETRDLELTRRMQAWSAPAMVLFGLTVTFASFDWLMSLSPAWYSTIFGVYVFAGAVVGSLAALALVTLTLQKSGTLRVVSTVEHRHDIGKLLFGFTVFYAYIAFSQYFLIWYADLPEETIFYHQRWQGGWKAWSVALVGMHFAVPFVLLLSRAGKRSAAVLGLSAAMLLVAHYVDLYWLVMPALGEAGARWSWVDLGALLGPLGLLGYWVARQAARGRLYPVGDPRLSEAVRLEVA